MAQYSNDEFGYLAHGWTGTSKTAAKQVGKPVGGYYEDNGYFHYYEPEVITLKEMDEALKDNPYAHQGDPINLVDYTKRVFNNWLRGVKSSLTGVDDSHYGKYLEKAGSYQFLQNSQKDFLDSVAISLKDVGQNILQSGKDVISSLSDKLGSSVSGAGSAISKAISGESALADSAFQYFDAPIAEKYKMNAETAYQEALANTSTQRSMQDLQAAGLNPILASGYAGAGAGTFAPTVVESPKQAASSGSSSNGSKLSKAIPALAGGLVGIITKNASAGNSAKSIASGIIDLLS